jgi:hypothetical protein
MALYYPRLVTLVNCHRFSQRRTANVALPIAHKGLLRMIGRYKSYATTCQPRLTFITLSLRSHCFFNVEYRQLKSLVRPTRLQQFRVHVMLLYNLLLIDKFSELIVETTLRLFVLRKLLPCDVHQVAVNRFGIIQQFIQYLLGYSGCLLRLGRFWFLGHCWCSQGNGDLCGVFAQDDLRWPVLLLSCLHVLHSNIVRLEFYCPRCFRRNWRSRDLWNKFTKHDLCSAIRLLLCFHVLHDDIYRLQLARSFERCF